MAALGMIEVFGFATSIVVADAVAKVSLRSEAFIPPSIIAL